MKRNKTIYSVAALAFSALVLSSCSDFLDTMPDNRAVMDTPKKISGLLTTAYPSTSYALVNELMSDNTDYMGSKNSLGDREGDMIYFWQDDRETGNDSPERMWSNYYMGIAKANQALQSIEELGGATNAQLSNSKGEALLLRAYNHFLLVNEFSMAYNSKTSQQDMGVYYSKRVEDLKYKPERGTVAEVYANIEKDIEEGLPLINDSYTVPKYHFTKQAAYAFAARFYLYYEKWAEAEKYASLLLGSNPTLRNYAELQAMPLSTSEQAVKIAELYCNADKGCNLLITTSVGQSGLVLGPWRYYRRYAHTNNLAETEGLLSSNIWGTQANVVWRPFTNSQGESNYAVLMKIPYEFEVRDESAGTGYAHGINVELSMDEALLNRAEANIMLKKYDAAASDMNRWMHNYFRTDSTLTPASIQAFYAAVPYAYSDAEKLQGSFKKHLNPLFAIDAEGSVQESMLQCVLNFRRIETLHQGLRWFDIKRYNIEIPRREIGANGRPFRNLDWLTKDDLRKAIQIPMSIVAAGLPENPRK